MTKLKIRDRDFTLSNDYKPLVATFYNHTPTKIDRQHCYFSFLMECVSSMVCIKGFNIVVADTLSVFYLSVDAIDLPFIARLQETDPELPPLRQMSSLHSLSGSLCVVWCDTMRS